MRYSQVFDFILLLFFISPLKGSCICHVFNVFQNSNQRLASKITDFLVFSAYHKKLRYKNSY